MIPTPETLRAASTWRLLKNLQSWATSIQFTCYEREQGRPTPDDRWLGEIGASVLVTTDELLRRERERYP